MPLHALLLRNEDADAPLELALLQLWAANDPERLAVELLALDAKRWRRLGLLLFASAESLVLALVAVLERVAARQSSTEAADRLLRRIWHSHWRDHLHEKVVDCHARLERSGRTDSLAGEDLVATRLLQILVTSLRVTLTSSHDDQPKDQLEEAGGIDAPRAMAVVDLLLSLSTCAERIPAIARVAALGLQMLLSLETHELSGLMTTHICRSMTMQHYVTWLLGDEGVAPASYLLTHSVALELGSPHDCDGIYLELLVAAATVARPDASKRRGARSPVFDDSAAMLQICTRGIASADWSVQDAALRLLCSLLVLDDASSSALSSTVRLSGILISISWLLHHNVSHIAATAATTLELIIRHSPPSDILRAVIEQGCVIIYRALLSACSGAKKPAAQAAVAASCRSLLNWVTEEVAWQSGVVAASVQSILSSTNVLLQKNIVLILQILAQRNATIREALEDQDFRTDALVSAIQADEEAGLAVSLLSTCLNCSDKCSTLKIESCTKDSSVFCRDNNDEQQEEEQSLSDGEEQDRTIRLSCTGGEFVEVGALLLRQHSNLLRGLKLDQQQDQAADSLIVLDKLKTFEASSVQLFVNLLPLTQQDAVSKLTKMNSFPTMRQLLHLANTIGSAKCWHVTTSAICRMMTPFNWLDIFQFASTDVRHPTLVLRCIRFALQLRSELGPRDNVRPMPQSEKQSPIDPADQQRADLALALKTAAIQMSQELFIG
ncbi:hypothetical protein PF005_g2761 [Phytophthora fragariae]|uniref:Uncharacterized protein n=1 Tax=Phytophthora fragariae TaxID=53985 RepID=A0A6A3FT98_9STRA|nr:hypothetical protein PF003_g11892 [Phytophthora fragariae]KAE8947310.1 hypothetical protein PF009_g3085 [Phytophthora fragariae]KAE9134342.1 hypothetical protein PF010_g2478 [Phytophthora fragariae]KAE9134967.1 hypothetical protein PF007_g2716 [Phytophthora fragariae]KAE9153494.1 hypothetical protein PF006_g2373 [Phytophthora fragariae]